MGKWKGGERGDETRSETQIGFQVRGWRGMEDLLEVGVWQGDVVIGFQHPHDRELSEVASA